MLTGEMPSPGAHEPSTPGVQAPGPLAADNEEETRDTGLGLRSSCFKGETGVKPVPRKLIWRGLSENFLEEVTLGGKRPSQLENSPCTYNTPPTTPSTHSRGICLLLTMTPCGHCAVTIHFSEAKVKAQRGQSAAPGGRDGSSDSANTKPNKMQCKRWQFHAVGSDPWGLRSIYHRISGSRPHPLTEEIQAFTQEPSLFQAQDRTPPLHHRLSQQHRHHLGTRQKCIFCIRSLGGPATYLTNPPQRIPMLLKWENPALKCIKGYCFSNKPKRKRTGDGEKRSLLFILVNTQDSSNHL